MIDLALLLLALLPQDQATKISATAPWHTVRLANGVGVNVLHVDAPKVAVFSFLPIGLDGDPAGRAQFSHLAEHMLIRSTDPKRLRIGRLQLNGETTNQVLRLESLASPELWREALSRHPRWLSAREFDGEVLAREKVRIAGEENTTVSRGYNHKWATAAWAQVVGGRDHAAVHGDVANATIAQLESYVASHVKLSEAQIFVVGPRPAKEVVAAVRAEFAKLQVAAAKLGKPASRPPVGQAKPGHRAVTWDLAADHYLEWYELPADTTAVEAEVLAQVLTLACFQDRTFADIPGRAVAGSVTRGGKRFVLLSCNLPKATKLAGLRNAFRSAIKRAPMLARLQVRGASLADRFGKLPDFAAQRQQVENPRIRDLIEANFAMQCGYACARLGVSIADVPTKYRALDDKRIVALLTEGCSADARHSVRISKRPARKPPK